MLTKRLAVLAAKKAKSKGGLSAAEVAEEKSKEEWLKSAMKNLGIANKHAASSPKAGITASVAGGIHQSPLKIEMPGSPQGSTIAGSSTPAPTATVHKSNEEQTRRTR